MKRKLPAMLLAAAIALENICPAFALENDSLVLEETQVPERTAAEIQEEQVYGSTDGLMGDVTVSDNEVDLIEDDVNLRSGENEVNIEPPVQETEETRTAETEETTGAGTQAAETTATETSLAGTEDASSLIRPERNTL